MPMNKDRLGSNMYAAVQRVQRSQETKESDDIGLKVWKEIASEIIKEVQQHATIAPLDTTSIPAAPGPHQHSPVTNEATGKIS